MSSRAPTFAKTVRVGTSYELRIAPNEDTVLALGRNVALWETGRKKRVASSHPLSRPSSADFAPAGDVAIVKSTSGESVLLDARSAEVVAQLGGAEFGEGAGPVFGPGGECFVEGSWNGDLLVRHSHTGDVVVHERGEGMINEICCSPDRDLFVYAFGAKTGADVELRVRRWPFSEYAYSTFARIVHCDALALTGGRLAVATVGKLSVWSVDTGTLLREIRILIGGTGTGLAWSPDGKTLVLARDDRVAAYTPDLHRKWVLQLPYACFAEFSQSGSLLALGSWGQGIVARLT